MAGPRILHLPKNPAGLATALASGERALGYDARVLTARNDFTDGRADIELGLERRRGPRYVVGHLNALRKLPEADTYHLWYGASLLHWPRFGVYLADLGWFTRNGRVVCTYVGSDARDMANRRAELRYGNEPVRLRTARWSNRWLDRGKRRSLQLMAERADTIYVVNPDLALDVPATTRFVPYAVPLPDASAPDQVAPGREPVAGPRSDNTIRVVHAPSNPDLKGSMYIDAAMERIVERFAGRVRYVRLDRVPRRAFHAALDSADIFVDQLLIGWYGVSAVEAMYRGVPTVCYIDRATLAPVPNEMRDAIPVCEATPSDVESVLESLIVDEARRHELAQAGLVYAHRWHDPVNVAQWVHASGPDAIAAASD